MVETRPCVAAKKRAVLSLQHNNSPSRLQIYYPPSMKFSTIAASIIARGIVVAAAPKNLIIDTDIHSDVDDAGALLLGATLPSVNLLGVNVNHPCEYSALAASAILAHYGHPNIPIGIARPLNNKPFFDSWYFELGEYTSKVAHHWSGGTLPWGRAEDAWDPVRLYRKLLSAAEDKSVTIASIGYLDNLSGLLNSTADNYSVLNGRELIKAKVAELVVMGGGYPSGHSWNFWGSNASLTAHVINTWDGKLAFVGDDVGKYVLSGGSLMASKLEDDPVRMGYIYYGFGKPLSSWDPLTVLYVANGLGNLFEPGNDHGYNRVLANGTNEWVDDVTAKQQRYLRLKASNETAAAELDRLYLNAARRFSKHKSSEGICKDLFKPGPAPLFALFISAVVLVAYFRPRRNYIKLKAQTQQISTTNCQ